MGASRKSLGMEELLEHADWVHGLAFQLVRDTARADDLVQEAWLTALQSPPRHASNLRAWLGTVVTRLAQTEWRSDRRRNARERRGARYEGLPPTDQLVHDAQLSSELVDAVVAMEDPYKTVLLLRYFRDFKPAQIARELDRPLGTVTTQLQRGLEKLRCTLDQRYGDRRSWCVALMPLARVGAPLLGLASLGPASWLTVAAVATIMLWALIPWPTELSRSRDVEEFEGVAIGISRDPQAEPRLPAAEQQVASGAANRRITIEAGDEASAVPATVRSTFTLSGLVLDLGGEPQAGVVVRWIDKSSLQWLDATRRLVTGPETWVPISAETLAALEADEDALAEFATRNFIRPDLAVALLQGEDPPEFTATTDGLGRFSMEVPEYSFSLELVDRQEDVLGRSKTVDSNGEEVRTWFIAARRSFSGRVVDTSGQAVEGATVTMKDQFPQALSRKLALGAGFSSRTHQVTSAADGSFVFEGVTSDERTWLTASKGDWESIGVFLEFPPDAAEEPLPVTLELLPNSDLAPRLVLRGRVRLDDGSPAPRATVVWGKVAAVTDAQGEYELSLGVAWGDLYAGRAGSGIAVAVGLGEELREVEGEFVLHDLTLPRASKAIEGRVLDASGAPVAGAIVKIADGIPLPNSSRQLEDLVVGRVLRDEETDRDGRFRIGGLFDRDYRLDVRLGARSARSDPIRSGERSAAIILP